MSRRTAELSEFVLALYRQARELDPDTFRRSTLDRLRGLVPFDFVAWGGGEADERRVDEVLVLDQDERVLTEWPEVGPWDRFCDLTLERLNETWKFDDVPRYRGTLAYNEHWRRYDVSHMMATIMHEPVAGYVSFLGMFHEDMARPFGEDERALVQLLMPHLAEALRLNREWTVATAAAPAEGTALVDGAGRILASREPFAALLQEEWGALPEGRVPGALVRAGSAARQWRGRRIQVAFRAFRENLLLRVRPASPLGELSPRARQVAELFGAGLSYKEVARRMGIAPETVRKHVAAVYEHLGIRSKADLGRLLGTGAGR